jgi:putative membrane protein
MKKIPFVFMLALGAWSMQACNSNERKDSVEQAEEINDDKEDAGTLTEGQEDDSEFAVKAASGGMMEVELGRMAQQKATNADVKAFAKMMVDDHTKANDELKALAASKNITLPTTLGADHQKKVDELSKLAGREFDKKYVSLMVDDHDDDIEAFKEAADDAKDPDIKAFAAKTLPTLQKHHDRIKTIKDKM